MRQKIGSIYILGLILLTALGMFLAACSGNATNTPVSSSTNTPGAQTTALASATAFAAGPSATAKARPSVTPTAKPSATSTAKPSATATSTAATNSGSVHFPCASPGACGFPDASNTGVPAGTRLTARSGNITIDSDGTVINGVNLQGSFDVYANNVTIENSRISSTNWWGINLRAGYKNLKILHCTIIGVVGKGVDNGGEDYGINNMGDGSMEVGFNNLSEFSNVLQMNSGNIHDNYVHDVQSFHDTSGHITHTDPFIATGGNSAALVLEHNTFLNQTTTDQGASAAIGLFDDFGKVTNSTVDRNWLAGGAYALYGGDAGATNIKVTNNVFSTQYWHGSGYYGSVAHWNTGGSGNVFSHNVFSNGSPVTL